ncbi:hypothetical protein HanXRQr2_Chr17g0802571 [Helianthus annuus]|uniref:Uncharacterized protein n=1 Tax=Helianthus annuus TaxID=4232 RepID=A0A9K3DIR8_HELAN|nr:hypothetical protein HanXRQr2_Chr17g0802571 [Helianthus annuus]KAJ0429145.1 hypothetical protein HanHA300_Chr17g0654031 [Helianthus annuus]KAJ0447502.1 hypothetical protein HanHA89_Chr17g0706121 [Helianthus annuus]KAJ0632378.1 hypothetical protein HanLR1_Chr17g0664481 [Helianthus annuus]KAJ0813143.1 hypothetical protein HanPSC8_Chr17g0770101 [Helianthus annuus]
MHLANRRVRQFKGEGQRRAHLFDSIHYSDNNILTSRKLFQSEMATNSSLGLVFDHPWL